MSKPRVIASERISFGSYVEPIRFGGLYCCAVAQMLVSAQPEDADAAERKCLRTIVARAEAVKTVITLRERFGGAHLRPALDALGNAWAAGHEMLAAQARFEGEEGDDARALDLVLFSDGLSFVRRDALAAWSEAQRRLGRIEEEGHVAKLTELVGATVLGKMRSTTAALCVAFGGGARQSEMPSKRALREANAAFGRGVAGYARVLAAKVDETDSVSVDRFLSALAPVDHYRAARAARGGSDEDEDETDVTEVTPTPTPTTTNGTPAPAGPFLTEA